MARALVQGLRARGLDVVTPIESGLMGRSDRLQLEFAKSQGRVLYTFNVGDFCRLHQEYLEAKESHAGIVVVPRQRFSIGEQIRGLSKLTSVWSATDMADSLVFLKV